MPSQELPSTLFARLRSSAGSHVVELTAIIHDVVDVDVVEQRA